MDYRSVSPVLSRGSKADHTAKAPKRSIDIAYVVSHGFAARMVTQTNLLGQLIRSGLKVALIAPDAQDENLLRYCQVTGVALYEFQPSSAFWKDQYFVARKYFLEDIHANPALLEKHIRATRFNTSRNPWRRLRPYLWYAAHQLVKRWPGLRDRYLQREEKHLQSEAAEELLDKIAPHLVVATYPVNFSEAMLLRAAKKQARQTALHLLSWDNITAKGRFPALAQHYLAWGPIMRQELEAYYHLEQNHIHVCGVPHFDLHYRNRRDPKPAVHLKALGLDPNKPYLFFGMSSPRFAPREIDIVEWLAAQITADTFGTQMQLIVRPHPQNIQGGMADLSWLPRLKALQSVRTAIDFPDLSTGRMPYSMQAADMERMSQMLAGASVSYNSGSTLSIDALMVDTPVILTSFDGAAKLDYWESARRLIDYVHLRKLVDCGGVCIANDYLLLEKHTRKFLDDPQYLMNKRRYTARQECANYDDGSATERCVNALHKILRQVGTARSLD